MVTIDNRNRQGKVLKNWCLLYEINQEAMKNKLKSSDETSDFKEVFKKAA